LAALAAWVPIGARVADVGTDHGLLPRHLLEDGRASFCVATERDYARLKRAQRALARLEAGGKAERRAGDGLVPLRPWDRLEVLVLAGLGGGTIVRILRDPRLRALGIRLVLLQPQRDPERVRRWLRDQHASLDQEQLVVERRRTYLVLAARLDGLGEGWEVAGLDPETALEAGPGLVRSRDPEAARHFRAEAEHCRRVLAGATWGRGRAAAERRLHVAERALAAMEAAGVEAATTSGRGGRIPPSGYPPGSDLPTR
jgi:tRNA (adenine22-N1)-methyltransferase